MKSLCTFLIFILIISSCKDKSKEVELTDVPVLNDSEEWVSLFNGKDLEGWDIKFSGQELNVNYKNTFRVEDSMLRVVYDEYENFEDAYAHLYYKKPYSYYKIRFSYRFTGDQVPGGESWNVRNSGLMYHSQSAASNGFDQDFPLSLEMQLLGGLSDGNPRPTANLCTPGTAFEINGAKNLEHCYNSNSETYDGDRWVSVEAVVLGDEKVIHIVEGDTVLIYQKPQIGSEDMQAEIERFSMEPADEWLLKDGQLLTSGYISLQAESHPIDFKNIELLDLCGCTDPKAKNYKSYFVKSNDTLCQYD